LGPKLRLSIGQSCSALKYDAPAMHRMMLTASGDSGRIVRGLMMKLFITAFL
jgi:hypothetical protein